MDGQKIKIRCPSCGKDGKARQELIGRRVACKHCAYEFRVKEIEEEESNGHPFATAPTPAHEPESKYRMEALEVEIQALRHELASRAAEHAKQMRLAEDRALDLEWRLAEPQPDREEPLLCEIESLKRQLDEAGTKHLHADQARERAMKELAVRADAQAKELRALQDELADAREDSNRAEVAREHLERELAQLRAEIESTEVEAAVPSEVDQLLDEVRGLREDLDRTRAEAGAEVRALHEELDRARDDARTAEALRLEVEAASLAAGQEHAEEIAALRAGAEDVEAEARAFEALRRDLEEAIVDRERLRAEKDELLVKAAEADRLEAEIEVIRAEFRDALMQAGPETIVDPAESGFGEFIALQADRDRFRAEADALRLDLENAEDRAREFEAKGSAEAELRDKIARLEREAIEERERAERELIDLRDVSEQAERELIEARAANEEAWLCDRRTLEAEAERLHAEVERAREAADARTAEIEQSLQALRDENVRLQSEAARVREAAQAEADHLRAELRDRSAVESISRNELHRIRAEADAKREENQSLAERLSSHPGELSAVKAEFARVQETLRAEVEEARAKASAEALEAARLADQLRDREAEIAEAQAEIDRLRDTVAAADVPPTKDGESAPAPSALSQTEAEAARRKAVDEAVKDAWADFERRLAETQAKLKAANARADLLEDQAREASEQVVAFQRGLELGDFTSFEDSQASMTNIVISGKRGGPPLTWANAESRLTLARQLAAERKDRPLIDRIGKVGEKVRADIENRNLTLAETLVRGVEIEVGLDPGGWSIGGQKIFRPSPSILASLSALAPAFDRVMRLGDHAAIRSTIREMRTVLGDQAGLPEIRRPGRVPNVKRPIAEADAARLFLAALENENWLMRPILANRPPPDTALMTYACLVEACAEVRDAVQRHWPDRLEWLDRVLQATAGMLTRRQQPDGHFPFLDPRGRASRFASVIEGMVAQQPEAVKDGWVVAVDPIGAAQVETGFCGTALAQAGAATGRAEWTEAARRAADWALGQPNLPNFLANASSLRLVSRVYREGKKDEYLNGIVGRLGVGLFSGQVENGRWVDASSAQTTNHLAILLALHDARDALPESRDTLHQELSACIDRAMGSLLAECSALGVPATGAAIRCLIRHRDQVAAAGGTNNPRIESAILDSATVIQELCHEGPKPKLGVSPDLLAALVRI